MHTVQIYSLSININGEMSCPCDCKSEEEDGSVRKEASDDSSRLRNCFQSIPWVRCTEVSLSPLFATVALCGVLVEIHTCQCYKSYKVVLRE